ncbi:MAG: trypsin-like peptidase domain-containing protein, partial [Armatimonadetes bacterium]|nr:trypsin-like peptidase domain-containing protein [Armatimonadota bacterium]
VTPPDRELEEFFKRFFWYRNTPQDEDDTPPAPQRFRRQGMGSGWIYSEDGYIVTNAHVVDGATKITVELHDRDNDNKEYPAKLVGTDPKTELAVIKVDAGRKLPTLKLGDSDAAPVASWVMAVGAPFQLEQTVTVGVISAKSRFLPGTREYIRLGDIIQTDAAINPGNSGGPLVNLRGEVIGINVAYRPGQFGGNAGIGFAIPANTARRVVPDLIEHKRVARGWLGVEIRDLSEHQKKFFGAENGGAWVSNITDDGPAAKSDLQVEDIIVAVDDTPIPDTWTLQRTIGATAPGTKVTLTVLRNKKEKKIEVTLGEMPDKYAGLSDETEQPAAAEKWPLGIRVGDLTPQLAQDFDLKRQKGVVVERVAGDSPAVGKLIPGMVILKVNGHEVENVKQYREQLDKAKKEGGDAVIFHIEQQTDTGTAVSLVDVDAEW